jgi:hypothetical protein
MTRERPRSRFGESTMAKAVRAVSRGGMRHPGPRLAAIRRFHHYIGVFIAPSLLFFAFTGALQLFSLHEAHGAYHPPALVESLGKVHKDQIFTMKPKSDADADHHPGDHADATPKPTTLALKVFFLFVAAGLMVSTTLGLWMALVQARQKAVAWVIFVAGAVIPVGLLLV